MYTPLNLLLLFFLAPTLSQYPIRAAEKKSESFSQYEDRLKQGIAINNAQEKLLEAIELLRRGFSTAVVSEMTAKESRRLVLKGLLVRKYALQNGATVPFLGHSLNHLDESMGIRYVLQPTVKDTHAQKTKEHNVDNCFRYQLLLPNGCYLDSEILTRSEPYVYLWAHPEIAKLAPIFVKYGATVSQPNADGAPALCFLLNFHAERKTKTVAAFLQEMYVAYSGKEAFVKDASRISAETFEKYLVKPYFSATGWKDVCHLRAECDEFREKHDTKA